MVVDALDRYTDMPADVRARLQQKMAAQFSLGISGFLDWDKTIGPSGGYEIGAGDPTEAVMAVREAGIAPGLGGQPVPHVPRTTGAPRTGHAGHLG